MSTEIISNSVLKIIEEYRNLQLGGKNVVTPYFINDKIRKDLRAMVGKGTPEEIIMEAKIWEKLKGIQFNEMSSEQIKQFLIDKGLGIDCSGFVIHALDALYLEKTHKHIWSFLKNGSRGLIGNLIYLLKPAENLGANTITGELNSVPIDIEHVRPGDVIRSKWKKINSHHIQLITKVTKDSFGKISELEYAHSTPYYGKDNGVKFGNIQIIDQTRPLQEQEWLEKDEHGVNFSFEGFMVDVNDNGLRRLRSMTF